MIKRTLFIHAGGPKTGSSALQNALELNAAKLKNLGFEYAHKVGTSSKYQITSGNGIPLFELLNGVSLANPWLNNTNAQNATDLLINNVKDDELDSLLLSYFEDMPNAICSSEFFSELSNAAWSHLIQALQRNVISFKVIYYVRDALPFYVSAYDQTIKRHGQFHTLEEFAKQQNWKHYEALKALHQAIPNDSLFVLSYESERNQLIDSFFKLLGISDSIKIDNISKKTTVNRSLSQAEREILITLNAALGDRYSTELSDLLIYANPEALPIHTYSNKFANQLEKRHDLNAKWINDTFFKGEKNVSVLFPKAKPNPAIADSTIQTQNNDAYLNTFKWAIQKLKQDANTSPDVLLNRLVEAASATLPNNENIPHDFDALSYLLLNQDVLLSGANPVEHFLNAGLNEDRKHALSQRRILPEQYETLLLAQKAQKEELQKVEQAWASKASSQELLVHQEKQKLELQIDTLNHSLQLVEQEKIHLLQQSSQQASEASKTLAERELVLNEALINAQKETQQFALKIDSLNQSLQTVEQEKLQLIQQATKQTDEASKTLAERERVLNEALINAQKETQQFALKIDSLNQSLQTVEQEKLQQSLDAAELERTAELAYAERERELHKKLLSSQLEMQELSQSWVTKASSQEQTFKQEILQLSLRIDTLNQSLHNIEQEKLQQALDAAEHERTAGLAYATRERELQEELLSSQQDILKAKNQHQEQLNVAEQAGYQWQVASGALKSQLNAIEASLLWKILSPMRKLAKQFNPEINEPLNSPMPQHIFTHGYNLSHQSAHQETTITETKQPTSIAITLSQPSYSANNFSTQISALNDLLALHDEAFIRASYQSLLGRVPDLEGFKYYLNRIRLGVSKIDILDQLYSSKEGKSHNAKLAGLNSAIRTNKWKKLPFARQISNWYSGETMTKLQLTENQLATFSYSINHQLEQANNTLLETLEKIQSLETNLHNNALSIIEKPSLSTVADVTHEPNLASSNYQFDASWYLETYPNVMAAGVDPLDHYTNHGANEDQFSCHAEMLDALFDTNLYLKTYPDVLAAGVNPFEHYINQGRLENRVGARLALSLFDADLYLTKNPDVATAQVDPLKHYIDGGAATKRPRFSFKGIDSIEVEPLVYSEPLVNSQVKLIAFYLPQFHPIKENDEWWGKGFTEWTNVTRAKPFYENHEQPRLPGELGFYDLRLVDVMKRQAELARAHGLFGFCFYIYWFGGKRLLEHPIEMLLRHPEIDINFCYCWANENWTRRWDGLENDVLMGQSHSPEDDIAFITSISAAFSDKRYIRVDGKPVLVVYRPSLFPDIKKTVKRWRNWCRNNSIGDLHICFSESFDQGSPSNFGMDASIQFPPSSVPRQDITEQVQQIDATFTGEVLNYLFTAKSAKSYTRPKWMQYRGVMPSWDNTARKMERGISFYGATPELYAEWLDTTVAETCANLPAENRLVFINAWNEWGEGAYLEPDARRGYAYLNHTRAVMAKYSDPIIHEEQLLKKKKKSNDVAVIVHLYYGDLLDIVASYLDNLSGKADLYFSVRDGCFPEIENNIKQRYPNAVVVSYPNHGRDVVPFLHVFSHIVDFGYKAICKIHTKKSKHREDGDQWRDDVFTKLLGNKTAITACLSKIKSGSGIVAPSGHLLDGSNYWGSNAIRVTELAIKMGCPQEWIDNFFFPAGTMFWFKPEALKPLMALNLKPDDFEVESGQVDGTTAHAVERLLGLSAMRAGFTVMETTEMSSEEKEDYQFAAKT